VGVADTVSLGAVRKNALLELPAQ